MQLSEYIKDLLYRYECVIVPDFGGFVSNTFASKLNTSNHQFTPPSKQISFNINLKQNDGLLANYVAKSLNISYDEATQNILQTVENWKQELQKAPLSLENIGKFTLTNHQLSFEPINKINYLASSYGLIDISANPVLRTVVPPVDQEKAVAHKKSYSKYIAAAAIFAGLFVAGNLYVNHVSNQQEIAAQQEITQQIQQASFTISTPLPPVTLNVEKKEIEKTTYKYHIIAGAFKEKENAVKKIALLSKKGYNANIIGVNKWGLTQVSYASFNDKRTAINTLNKIKREDNKHAWLFINE